MFVQRLFANATDRFHLVLKKCEEPVQFGLNALAHARDHQHAAACDGA